MTVMWWWKNPKKRPPADPGLANAALVDDFFLSEDNRDDLIILNRGSQIIEAMNEANGKVMGRFNPPIYSTGYLVFRSEDNSDMVECFKSHVLAFYEEAKISSLSNEAFKD